MKKNLMGFGVGMVLVLIGAFMVSANPGVPASVVITLGLCVELFFLVKIVKHVWQTRNDMKQ